MKEKLRLKSSQQWLALLLFACISTISAQTNTFTGATGGNWGNAGNWSLGIPTNAHDVIIPDNRDVNVNVAAVCNSITISGGANANTVSIGNNYSLTVSGTVTIEAPTANNINKILDVQSGILTCANIVMATTGGNNRDCRIKTAAGTINVSGNIIMNGVAQRNQLRINGNATNGGTLNLGGSLSGGDFLSNNSNSTLNFNGTAVQILPVNSDYIYNKITINNTAGVTLQSAITTTNTTDNIAVQSGFLDNGGFSIDGNAGKTFSVSNGAVFKVSGTTSAFPNGFGTVSLGITSAVEYSGTGAQAVYDVAAPGYGNLTLSSASVKTAPSGLDIQGTVTVNTGATFALSSFSHAIGGNLSSAGTVTATTGSITVGSDLTNMGIFTAGTTSAISVTGNFTNSGIFTAGTGASSLSVKGNWANNGTFSCGTAGTVTLNSTSVGKTITGTTSGLTGKFYKLTLNGSGGAWTASNNLEVSNDLIFTNGSLTAGGILTIGGPSALNIGAGAGLTLESNASLIQSGYTGANSGNIIVKRNSAKIILDDFTYWSSPTTGTQTLLNFSPATQADKFFSYNNAWILENTANTFGKGIGYAIRSPENATAVPLAFSFQFTGVPNNGSISVPVSVGEKLVGNPYPSTLDANAFISANVVGLGSVNQTITGTLYFWTHNHSLNGNNYASSDYAVYTKLGGTGVLTGTGNITVPSQNIASGQGFFVELVSAGNITFNNGMRAGANNSNFYKHANVQASPMSQNNRIWLNLTNTTDSFSQALIGYTDEATNAYDAGYDGTFYGNDAHVLYSLLNTDLLSIQAKALPFLDTDLVPLGYKVNTAGNTSISLDHYDGIFENGQNIYLEDLLLGTIHDLKAAPYNFSSASGTFNDRFVLRYTDQNLGIEDPSAENSLAIVAGKGAINIASSVEKITDVVLFDLLGRTVFEKHRLDQKQYDCNELGLSSQTYIASVTLANGKKATKKIIL